MEVCHECLAFARKTSNFLGRSQNCRRRHSTAIFCTKASRAPEWEDKNKLQVLNDPLNIENWWNEIKQQISIRKIGEKIWANGALPSRKFPLAAKIESHSGISPKKKGTKSSKHLRFSARTSGKGWIEFVRVRETQKRLFPVWWQLSSRWSEITKLCTKVGAFDVGAKGFVCLLAKAADLAHKHVASFGTLYSQFHK